MDQTKVSGVPVVNQAFPSLPGEDHNMYYSYDCNLLNIVKVKDKNIRHDLNSGSLVQLIFRFI